MKVLVIGNGAREHALAWRLKQSPRLQALYAAPGNAGMARLATCVPIESSDIVELADFAKQMHVGLTVVGPELPLALGIVDEFRKRDLKVFGPTQAATEIEASKVYAKRFMRTHGIPTADFTICSSAEEAHDVLDRRGGQFPVVIKADGLAAGKGVLIGADREQADAAIEQLMGTRSFGKAGERVIIEDYLAGPELSFQVICDGRHAVPLATAQDYKRLLDGDRGPNTGGMGSICPSKMMTPEMGRMLMREVVAPTLSGLEKEGRAFTGVLYCGIMLTASGPRVLEYNARLGDPETQSLLPRLETDLLDLLLAAVGGRLENVKLSWKKEVSVSVVLASGGYPGSIRAGRPIRGVPEAEQVGARVFHAGTRLQDGALVTAGGRVLTVNGCAPSRTRAAEIAYRAVDCIDFEDKHFRRDIGQSSQGETGAFLRSEL